MLGGALGDRCGRTASLQTRTYTAGKGARAYAAVKCARMCPAWVADGSLVVPAPMRTFNPSHALIPPRSARLAATPSPPHALPASRMAQSDGAVFLLRQYLHSSLAQRVSRRPFLTPVERAWIAFQLVSAAAQLERAGVCHGDIKPANVLLTSWDWAVLADFAPYKPVALPADDPANFSFFYDTAARRSCCIAPERFYDQGETPPATLTHAADIFSVGATIADLFLEGEPLFDYSEVCTESREPAGAPRGFAREARAHRGVSCRRLVCVSRVRWEGSVSAALARGYPSLS